VFLDADLPGGTHAQAWVSLNVIVVLVNGDYLIANRHSVQLAELKNITAVLQRVCQGRRSSEGGSTVTQFRSSAWHDERGQHATYRIHRSGRVVAYGPERDGPRPNLWIASEWSADPRTHPDAKHLQHLCCDATREELLIALSEWADELASAESLNDPCEDPR
jgi:hypothetical protein